MKINRHQTRFSVGEYSVAGLVRTDQEKTLLSAEIQENLVPSLIGQAQVRPGTEYLASTLNNVQARIIPFVRSADDAALIELTPGKLRVMVEDSFVRREAVNTALTNGDFSNGATGWTLSATSGASSSVSGNQLRIHANAKGSSSYAEQMVDITALGTQHGLRIDVERGPVLFRLGTTSNGQEVITDQLLTTGTHSIAFTPTDTLGSSYYIRLSTTFERESVVNSIQFESDEDLELDAPWTADELREISFDQAEDVIVFAHPNWQPRRIERRGLRSWSLVKFEPFGGPVTRVSSAITADPLNTRNNTQVSTNEDVFTQDMEGAVIRFFHDNFNPTFLLAGDKEFTDTFVVKGIKGQYVNDRQFSYSISGSWSGTIKIQRSISGPDGDYIDYPLDESTSATAITSNVTNTHAGFTEDNNLEAYHRIGFTDYTSGSARVEVSYQADSGYGWGRITDVINPRVANIEVIDDLNSQGVSTAWDIGTWGSITTWPSCVAFYDNRLFFGGRNTVWGSALNDFTNFDDLETSDIGTITRTLGSGRSGSTSRWFLPVQRLLVGTDNSAISLRAGAFDEAITPVNVTLKDAATIGANYVSPVKLDSRGVFVHSSNSDVYVAKPGTEDYTAERLTIYNEDICDAGIVELAAQREPETLVWCVRSDGQVPVIMYEFEGSQDTQCWWRFITNGSVESVAVLPGVAEDRVYLSVNRTPDTNAVPETGAEELAPSGVDVVSLDFTDQSILVVDSGNSDNDKNNSGQLDSFGFETGPDSLIDSTTSDPKLLLQSSGYVAYQPHNFAPVSYEWERAGLTKVGLTVGSGPVDLVAAPDGQTTVRSLVITQANGVHYFTVPLPTADASGDFRPLFEVSFYARFSEASDHENISVTFAPSTYFDREASPALGDFCATIFDLDNPTGFPSQTTEGTDFELADDWSSTAQEDIWEDVGNGWVRIYVRARVSSSDAAVFIQATETSSGGYEWAGNGVDNMRIWGLSIARLPTPSYLAGNLAELIQHQTESQAVALPYQYDVDGNIEGIRLEPSSSNLLSSSEDFAASAYIPENAIVNYTGLDTDPMRFNTATQLQEDGLGSVRHGMRHEFAGGNGQYVFSAFIRQSELGWIALRMQDGSSNSYLVNFNTLTGEVVFENNVGLTSIESGVEQYGFDWWRVWLTADLTVQPPAAMISNGTASVNFVDGRWQANMAGTSSTAWISIPPIEPVALSSSGSSTASFTEGFQQGNMLVEPSWEGGSAYATGWFDPNETPGGGGPNFGDFLWYATTSDAGLTPQDGTYFISCFSFNPVRAPIIAQDIDVSNFFSNVDIDSGTITLDFSFWHACPYSDLDTVRAQLNCYTESLGGANQLPDGLTPFASMLDVIPPAPGLEDTWYNRQYKVTIPANTRTIRVIFESENTVDDFLNSSIDNVVLQQTQGWDVEGKATASFTTPPKSEFESDGAATVSFSAEATVESSISSSNSATFDAVPNVGRFIEVCASTVSFGASADIVSNLNAAGVQGGTFAPGGFEIVDLSSSGSVAASFVSDVQPTSANVKILLANTDDVTLDSNNQPVYEQTEGLGQLIWGAQLEYNRSRPSTYIRTHTGVTRASDAFQADLASIPWDNTQASIFSEISRNHLEAGEILSIISGTDAHKHELDATAQSLYRITDTGVDQAEIIDDVAAESTIVRLASSAAVNDAKFVVDAGSALTDTSLTMPGITTGTVLFGNGYDGLITRAMILPQTSTEEELQEYGEITEPPVYRYIEKLSLRSEAVGGTINKMADSGLFFGGPASSVTLPHLLERTDIVAWATDANGSTGPLTGLSSDVSGVVNLGGTYTDIWIGTEYQARFQSSKLAYMNRGGTPLLQRKRVAELGLLLENTHRDSVRFGGDFTTLRQMDLVREGAIQPSNTIYSVYDGKSFSFPGLWDTDARVCLQVSAPYPATFLGLIIGLEWHERGLGVQ